MRKLPSLLTKSDRRGLIFIVVTAAVLITGAYFLGKAESTTESVAQDSLNINEEKAAKGFVMPRTYNYGPGENKAELFPFDPNTADSTELLRLGLKPYLVRNIYHYRAAGGEFRKPEDFACIHGLTMKQYETLRPYIVITDDYRMAADVVKEAPERIPRDTIAYPRKLKEGETIELNSADTTELRKVRGIGPYYARAIVRYRERLGGYYSTEQLKEIEGFPEEALPFLTVNTQAIRRLAINSLSQSQLRSHPYISFSQAKEIATYRRVKGYIRNAATLRMFKNFTNEDLEKLLPYVDFSASEKKTEH